MKILAIDSSGLVATVALLDQDILVGEYTIHNKKTHSQTLLPMIDAMLSMAEVPVEELDARSCWTSIRNTVRYFVI